MIQHGMCPSNILIMHKKVVHAKTAKIKTKLSSLFEIEVIGNAKYIYSPIYVLYLIFEESFSFPNSRY